MHDVEEAVRTAGDKELTPEDTKKYVHGYAVWGETTHLNSRLITLKWPSLFKKYQFNMALDGNGVVRGVETELPVADAMDPMVHSMEAAAMSATRPAATEAPAEGTEATPPADAAEATAAAPESDSK